MAPPYNEVLFTCILILCDAVSVQSYGALKLVNGRPGPGKCQDKSHHCQGSYLPEYDTTCSYSQRVCSSIPQIQSTKECEEENIHIITRDSWGAREPKETKPMVTPVKYFLIHHTAGWRDHRSCDTQKDCIEEVKSIQDYHMDDNKWDDIGYHYLIGGDGSVFEGRGWQHAGSHSPGYNNISIGVCLIGNFDSKLPTSKASAALLKLHTCLQRIGKLTTAHSVYGHRDVRQTECPGDRYYPTLEGTFGASWHRENPPEYYSECRIKKGKCQKETEPCDGEYHVWKASWKFWDPPYLCPEYSTDNEIKCCIRN